MRLVYLILLLIFPAYAHAAPVVVAAVLYAAEVITIGQLLLTVAVSVYGAAQQRKQRKSARKARDEYNASLQDRTITQIATEAPHVYVYGRAKVGSTVVAMFTSGAKDEYKHLVCVHAAHECDGIEGIYVAGKELGTLTADGLVTGGYYYKTTTEYRYEAHSGVTFDLSFVPNAGTLIVGKNLGGNTEFERNDRRTFEYTLAGKTVTLPVDYGTVECRYRHTYNSSTVRVQKHLGTPDDPVDLYLHSLFPDRWPATAVLRGFCYTVITLDLNQPEFQGGIPSIEVLLRGKKLYDPRTGLTQWSQNNALVVRDYLTSELCGVDPDDLPASQFIASANVCDESIAGLGARYTFNGTVTSDQDQASVLEQMAQSMAGGIVSTTWDIYAGKYVAPVMVLDQEDIVGQIAITPGVSDADLYNGVKGQYISDETSYVATDIKPYQNEAYVESDGRELWTDISFPFTDKIQRVHNLARIFTEDQRNGYTVKAEYSLKAWKLKVGQRVVHNSAFFGWNSKIFRVTDKQFSPTSAVELTLKEDAAEIWDLADAVTADVTPNTNLKNPFFLDPPASLTCESGTEHLLMMHDGTIVSRIKASWPAVAADIVEVEWTDGDVWSNTKVNGSDTSVYLSPVNEGVYYTVRARTFNPYLNVKSDWTYATHQVVGKAALPSDVPWFAIDGDKLTWGTVSDIDLAGYILKYHVGSNLSWGDANPLHEGLITENPWTPSIRPQDVITLMIKAVDTSGNESGNARSIQTRLGDVLVANVIDTFDFKALSYPGTVTGGTIIEGILQADGTENFYGSNPNEDFYEADRSLEFYSTETSAMTYETSIIAPSMVLSGSNMTISVDMTGGAIYYRIGGEEPMFADDGAADFYGDPDSDFYPPLGDYIPWPGQITARPLQHQFLFSIQQSTNINRIDACSVVIDAPDMIERLNGVVIGSSGTRLPITKPFTSIQNVQMTLESDGGSAVSVEIVDKDSYLGPLVRCKDDAGVLTTGKLDATIQGY